VVDRFTVGGVDVLGQTDAVPDLAQQADQSWRPRGLGSAATCQGTLDENVPSALPIIAPSEAIKN
jgi:hypothetical protein